MNHNLYKKLDNYWESLAKKRGRTMVLYTGELGSQLVQEYLKTKTVEDRIKYLELTIDNLLKRSCRFIEFNRDELINIKNYLNPKTLNIAKELLDNFNKKYDTEDNIRKEYKKFKKSRYE